jgi:hypothetical protein
MVERFLELLPEDGKPLYFGELMRRAHLELHLSGTNAGAQLSLLCSDRRAISEVRAGHQFVRRLPAHAEVVYLPRPRSTPTPLRRVAGWR